MIIQWKLFCLPFSFCLLFVIFSLFCILFFIWFCLLKFYVLVLHFFCETFYNLYAFCNLSWLLCICFSSCNLLAAYSSTSLAALGLCLTNSRFEIPKFKIAITIFQLHGAMFTLFHINNNIYSVQLLLQLQLSWVHLIFKFFYTFSFQTYAKIIVDKKNYTFCFFFFCFCICFIFMMRLRQKHMRLITRFLIFVCCSIFFFFLDFFVFFFFVIC